MRWNRTIPILSLFALLACGESSRNHAGDPEVPAGKAASPGPEGGHATHGSAGDTPMEITAVVAGRETTTRGLGECQHAPEGSIYLRPAALWTARFDGDEGDAVDHLNLTFWRERSGVESVTLALEMDSQVHRIATVEGGERQGVGRAMLEGDARAGVLIVEGTSAEGTPVRLRVRCERFSTLVAEGG